MIAVSNLTTNQFQYKAKQTKDSFSATFLDTKSDKKVEISLDEKITSLLYGKFKDDMEFEDKTIKVSGNLQSYFETMWQKFRFDRGFEDTNHDNILNPDEFVKAQTALPIEKVVNSDEDADAIFESDEDMINFFDTKEIYDKFIRGQKQWVEKHQEDTTFNNYFLDYISMDTNFDTKVTNKEMITIMEKDPIGKKLMEEARGGIGSEDAILRAILAWIEKKKEDIAHGLSCELNEMISEKGFKVDTKAFSFEKNIEDNPLAYLLTKEDKKTTVF